MSTIKRDPLHAVTNLLDAMYRVADSMQTDEGFFDAVVDGRGRTAREGMALAADLALVSIAYDFRAITRQLLDEEESTMTDTTQWRALDVLAGLSVRSLGEAVQVRDDASGQVWTLTREAFARLRAADDPREVLHECQSQP